MKFITVFLLGVAIAPVSSLFAGIPGVNRSKIICCGWDTRVASPEELLANADQFDRLGFDGTFVMLAGSRADGLDKGKYNTRTLSSAAPWTVEQFEPHLKCLREFANHKGLRESLVFCRLAPGKRLDWRDEQTWQNFAHNAGVLATVAREAGLKGIVDDNEDYDKTGQWYYNADQDGGTYEELRAFARRRGEQIGQAIFSAYPEAVVLSMWHLSMERKYFKCADPVAQMREDGDLWPAFFEGWVRSCSETGKLVDGDEHCYFCQAADKDFYVHFWNIYQGALGLLSPEVRKRYLGSTVMGGGIYLDMFTNVNPKDTWYFAPEKSGASRMPLLATAIAQGARVTGDYLWVYGEKGLLINWRKDFPNSAIWKSGRFDQFKTWEEQLSGFSVAVRAQTEPQALAQEILERTPGTLIDPKWSSWQHERLSHGELSSTNGLFVATGVANGCFIFKTPVKVGKVYAFEAEIKGRGTVNASWYANDKQLGELPGYMLTFGNADAEGWRKGQMAICVPPKVDSLNILAVVTRQGDAESTQFRNLRVVHASN